MKNMLIVGGLGYLGMEVASQLEAEGLHYSVLDNKMMKGYSYPEEIIKLHEENYISSDNALLEEFDTVLFCSDIDVEEFYSSGEFDGYTYNLISKVHEQVKKFPKKDFYYVYSNTGDKHGEFLTELFDIGVDYKNFKSVYCPVLYGISDRCRNDTLINAIICDLMLYKQYIIECHPFDICEFESVVRYGRSLIGLIVNGKKMVEDYDKLPVLNIASLIQWDFGHEYSIGHNAVDLHSIEINDTIRFNNPDALTDEINRITKAVEKKLCDTFLTDNSNNQKIIESSITSKNFTKRIVE